MRKFNPTSSFGCLQSVVCRGYVICQSIINSFTMVYSFIFVFLLARYKVQVTKPSTVLKLKTNFLSLLSAEKQAPQINDIIVSVVRNSQIVSIMVKKYFFSFVFSLKLGSH